MQSASPPPATLTPNVQFVMHIPAIASASAASKHTMDFTASTQSVTIAIGAQVLKKADVSASSSLCTAATGGRTCTVGVAAPTGNDQFTITAYDQANAAGNIIGQAMVSQAVSATPSTVNVTVNGTIVKIAVSLSNPDPPVGTAATVTVGVTGYDVDGNAVLGSYPSSVSLQDSDTSGATSLSATTVTSASTPVTLNYTGAKPFLSATITASLSGIAPASAVFAPLPRFLASYPAPQVSYGGNPGEPGIWNIAKGSDGNMWVVATGYAEVLKVALDGTMTAYPLSDPSYQPTGIVAGSDGNLWFAEGGNAAIGKITTAGVITEYTLPGSAFPDVVALGPDGNVWFDDFGNQAIGKITPSGTITEYPLPANASIDGIAAGADGNLWLADVGDNAILKVSTSGQIVATYPVPTANAQPQGITAGPDGNVWFTEYSGQHIGRITPSGSIAEFAIPTGSANPQAIVAGPDGRMWFAELSTEAGQGKIGFITVDGKHVQDFFNNGYHVHDLAFDAHGMLWLLELQDLTPFGNEEIDTFAY
jgi:streptogramin lyase